jgi:hypothetical protein
MLPTGRSKGWGQATPYLDFFNLQFFFFFTKFWSESPPPSLLSEPKIQKVPSIQNPPMLPAIVKELQ